MKYRGPYMTMVIIVVLALITTGCAGTSKPSTFYLLSPLPESGAGVQATEDQSAPSVLVGPISLPAYLDRPQIVSVTADHQLLMNEFDRWAEPLKDNISRVLTENLSQLMGTPAVFAYAHRGNKATDFRVVIDVTRFDFSTEGMAYLTAFWTVSGKKDKVDLAQKKSVISITASSQDHKGRIDAQNRALTQLSREIAAMIQALQR